jgi:hypothetical protein
VEMGDVLDCKSRLCPTRAMIKYRKRRRRDRSRAAVLRDASKSVEEKPPTCAKVRQTGASEVIQLCFLVVAQPKEKALHHMRFPVRGDGLQPRECICLQTHSNPARPSPALNDRSREVVKNAYSLAQSWLVIQGGSQQRP